MGCWLIILTESIVVLQCHRSLELPFAGAEQHVSTAAERIQAA